MKQQNVNLYCIWVGIIFALILSIIANCRVDIHVQSYPNIKCKDVIDTQLISIKVGIMNRGRGDFWRNDVHFEDDVQMVWCEVNHGDNFYYSKYLEGYGTDFMNMRNESVKCLMEFTDNICE